MLPESGFRVAPNWPWTGKITMTSQFFDMTSSLVSYWFKFDVNIIIGYIVNAIYFYKALTRNPEIGNVPVWVLPNICRLGQLRDTKFDTDFSNEMLLNAAKCQGYSFYHSEVTKGKPGGWGGGVKIPPPTQIRVK